MWNFSGRGGAESNPGSTVRDVVDGFPHEYAEFSQFRAHGVVECVDVLQQPEKLLQGWWVVVAEFEGRVRAWRFEKVERKSLAVGGEPAPLWNGIPLQSWTSSLSCEEYIERVHEIQRRIAVREIQQANLTRVLRARLGPDETDGAEPSAAALYRRISHNHGAPYAGYVHVGQHRGDEESIWLVSASPEKYFAHNEDIFHSTPIKGTGRVSEDIAAKDEAESLLVARAMAAELETVARPDSIEISDPYFVSHPGLVHLVREISGRLEGPRSPKFWRELFTQCAPPLSVAGIPRPAAKDTISACEGDKRGPYCGVFGWVDGDNDQSELAVTIRSFWWRDGLMNFGTGAGITAASIAVKEWEETQLKAQRLLNLTTP